jgi:hypothetical protein
MLLSCVRLNRVWNSSGVTRCITVLVASLAGLVFAQAPEQAAITNRANAVVIEVQPLRPPAQRVEDGAYRGRSVDERVARQSAMAPSAMQGANARSAASAPESAKRCPPGLVVDAQGRCH